MTDDGQTYGPVSKQELDSWAAEGRLTAESQILREGSDRWQWASDEYPQLAGVPHSAPAGPGADPENPFAFVAADASPTARAPSSPPAPVPLLDLGGDSGGHPVPRTSRRSVTGTGAAGRPLASEPAWYSVLDGLIIAIVSLGIALVCFFLLSVSRLWSLQAARMSPGAGALEAVRTMIMAMSWSTVGLSASTVSLVTGWCLCLKVPRRVRADIPIRLAVGAVGGLILLAFIKSVLPSIFEPNSLASLKIFARTMETIDWLIQVVAVGGLVSFAFFLYVLGKFFSHRKLPLLAVSYSIFAGVHVIWMTAEASVIEADSRAMKTLVAVLFMVFGLGHFGWLAYMSFTARETSRRAIARSERT